MEKPSIFGLRFLGYWELHLEKSTCVTDGITLVYPSSPTSIDSLDCKKTQTVDSNRLQNLVLLTQLLSIDIVETLLQRLVFS